MHNPTAVLENDTHKLLWDFDIKTDTLIGAWRQEFKVINQKKRPCKIVDVVVLADHRIKLKESEQEDKYLELVRNWKKLWNMKMTFMPIVIGAYGTVSKKLLKLLEDLKVGGRLETFKTAALLRTPRVLRRILETWGDILSLKFQWKTLTQRVNIMLMMIGHQDWQIIKIAYNTEKAPEEFRRYSFY